MLNRPSSISPKLLKRLENALIKTVKQVLYLEKWMSKASCRKTLLLVNNQVYQSVATDKEFDEKQLMFKASARNICLLQL